MRHAGSTASVKPKVTASLLIWLASSGLSLLLYLSGMLTGIEAMSYDWRMRLFNSDKAAPPEVAIIMIDEASMAYMEPMAGRWPWPRSVHADLIEVLSAFGPKAVLFDLIFAERDRQGVTDGQLSPHDQRLVNESAANEFVVHAVHFGESQQAQPVAAAIADKAVSVNLAGPLDLWSLPHEQQQMITPFSPLDAAARHLGIVSAEADPDGVYRRSHLLHRQGDFFFPALSTAGLLIDGNATVSGHRAGQLEINGRPVPLAADGSYLINHYARITSYPYSLLISTHRKLRDGDVENLELDPSELEGKILFVGTNATALYDMKPTPLDASAPGVFIHASITGNILTGDFLRPITPSLTITLLLLLGLLCSGASLWHERPVLRLVAAPILTAAFVAISLWLFSSNVVTELMAPLLAAGGGWGGAFLYLSFTEGRDKRRIRRMLSQYVSPAILTEVEKRHEEFLDAEVGTRENLTILFSDIRSFTSISESMEAEKVVEMLNIYMTRMNDAIFMFDGTIDKFIGDAIMAFWGAPLRTPDHAYKAVLSAMRMIRYLPEVNEELSQRGYAPLAIGIGINTGEVVLGNIGSNKKLDYTVIGDNVNLASRLEGLTKQYDCPIVISEYTQAQVGQTIPCRLLDLVRVKGKHHPIRLYAPVIADSEQEIEQGFALCEAHEQAFRAYLEQDWGKALELYQRLPEDYARNMMMERCRVYQREMPEDQWDGVFTMKTK